MLDISLPAADLAAGYRLECLGEPPLLSSLVAWSDEVNACLRCDGASSGDSRYFFDFTGDYDMSVLGGDYLAWAHPHAKAFFAERGLFDGRLLGQAASVRPGSHDVDVHAVGYLSVLMSDNIADVAAEKPESLIRLGRMPAFADKTMLPVEESRCANAIGASTLAETSDGFLILNRQGRRSATNPGLYAPSGSGAVELSHFLDMAGKAGRVPIADVVFAAANRELEEESGVPGELVRETALLGYARVPVNNGQPEYFCFTRLSCTRKDVEKNYAEVRLDDEEGFSEPPVFIEEKTSAAETLSRLVEDAGRSRFSIQLLAIQRLLAGFEL